MTKTERDAADIVAVAADIVADAIAGATPPTQSDTIQRQIESWTRRISASLWQAYRAGQAQSGASYSETGHELAAQEVERLRGEVQRLTDELRSTQREWDKTRATLNEVAGARQVSEQERDLARAAISDIHRELLAEQRRHRDTEWAAREMVRVLEGERDAARAAAKIAEASLVTTAKERDAAADKARKLCGQLQERADQWAKAIVDKNAAQCERDAALDDLEGARLERDAAREEVAMLRESIGLQAIDALKAELDQAKADIDAAWKARAELATRTDRYLVERNDAQHKLAQLRAGIDALATGKTQ
jgi:chromosome segregation ATPase